MAAAATVAWFLAGPIGSHPDPFFAPIAAVVALNASYGERGLNALRLLLGVLVGILCGEAALLTLGSGYGSLGLAVLAGVVIARALGGRPVVVAQAASAAILTIAVADGQGGLNRLIDAAIGASVALVFSQLLFTPEPIRLLHRAESEMLHTMAKSLRLVARALSGQTGTDDEAMNRIGDLLERMSEVSVTRAASLRITRHSLTWRARSGRVVQEQTPARQLERLGVSCLLLTRAAFAAAPADDHAISHTADGMAELLTALAGSPSDPAARQLVIDNVPALLTNLDKKLDDSDTTAMAEVLIALRLTAVDLLVFAGADGQLPPRASGLA